VPGKKPGDMVVLGGLMGVAVVMAVNKFSSRAFMLRGGRFPAPVTALTN